MNIFEKFLNSISYKFPKGYPDMNNEQDISLLESLVSEVLGENIILEKSLAWADLSDASRKFYRLNIINDKIKNRSPFELEDGRDEILSYTDDSYGDLFANQKVEDIKKIGGPSINNFPFFKDSKNNKLGFKSITKTKELGGTGGSKSETTERQERGLINLINSVKGPKNVISKNGFVIKNVDRAEKIETTTTEGTEPYSDIKLILTDGSELLISAKGPSTPTLGSGGIAGIKVLTKGGSNTDVLNFVKSFYDKAYDFYKKIITKENLKGQNLYKNKLIPDVSIKVPKEIISIILKGTPEMGGPVSYYYIGDMNVQGKVNGNNITLENGSFIPLDTFIKEKANKLYAHIRKRDGDLYFTTNTQNLNGVEIPIIFSKKPDGGGAQSRFGIIDKIRGIEIS